MGWTRKDLLTIRELEPAEITTLIDTAASLQEIAGREIKKVPALRGKTIVNLFYENSTRMLGRTVTVAGPPTLIPPFVQELGVKVAYRLDDAIRDVDVIMMLRLQQERMTAGLIPSLREYSRYWGLTLDKLRAQARPDVLIMHPGPVNRGVELSPEVADGPYSVILDQVAKGGAVRMGVLLLLAGARRDAA